MAGNSFQQLNDLYGKLQMLPAEVTQVAHLSTEDKTLLKRIGLTTAQVRRDLLKDVQIHYDRYSIYHQIERCLSGDTKIWLLDGSSPTIKEMAENPEKYIGKYTFSINPTTLELEPDKIISAKKTRKNARLIRVHLDSGKYVDTTPDHRFMLRDGTYREAQYLQPNSSLMPLYLKYPDGPLKNYLLVYKPKTDSYSFIHRVVAKFLDSTYKTSQGRVPHHVDFNIVNNDPSNIQIMDSTEHKRFHGRICRRKHKPDCNCGSCKAKRGETKGENNPRYGKHPWNYGLTKETDPRMAEIANKADKKVEVICQECGKKRKVSPSAAGKYCSTKCANIAQVKDPVAIENHRKARERVSENGPSQKQLEHLRKVHEKNRKQKEIRICLTPDCNVTFEVFPSSKRKYCCRSCANRDIAKRKDVRQKHSVTQSNLWGDKEYKENQTEKQQSGRSRIKRQKAQLAECLLNHKVTRVEFLDRREDTYDITTERNHNFPLEVGIFVHNSLEHPLVGAATELYGNYCCLTADTKIPLLDGRTLTIKEILQEQEEGKENWVYSCDYNGKPQPSKILHAIKQKHKPKTFRVWLDNGKYVDASDNHRFIKRDGTLCRADELEVGDSLMPFHRTHTKNGYELVWDVAEESWIFPHFVVDQYFPGSNLEVARIERKRSCSTTKELVPSNNHKIVKIEYIGEKEVYDIEVSGSHLFGLDIGIYIHNTVFSPLHNSTCWITSESPTYQRELTKMLDRIGIEEKIFDWAYTTGSYGDLFVKVNGIPGKGVISIADDEHPLNTSRVDHDGVLIGYYKTPMGQTNDAQALMAPWEYVHFRLLGGKKKRPRFGDPKYSEFRTMHLLTGMDVKQVTTKYGTSLLLNALPSYRRLRLAEDSLLLARLSRGLIRYIWKLQVDGTNMEAVNEIVDQYSRVLREARAVDTRADSPNFDCLRGDTEIRLCNGKSVPIKKIVEDKENYIGRYVWTTNSKTLEIEPKRIIGARKARLNAKLVRVHLDNNKHVDCTPDHRFMLRDGTYKEAQYLQPNDSLMPFYSKMNTTGIDGMSGYELIYNPKKKGYVFAHRVTFTPKQRKGYVIHHKDFNPLNNDPDNLVRLTTQEHGKVHCGRPPVVKCFITKWCECGCGGQFRKDSRSTQKYIHGHNRRGAKLSKEHIEVFGRANRGKRKGSWEIRICAYVGCNNTFEVTISSGRKYCSTMCANKIRKALKETRICIQCGQPFDVLKWRSKKYCVIECYWESMKGKPSGMKGRIGTEAWNKDLTKETDERMAGIAEALTGRKGHIAWNKGLTKETDERVAKYSESSAKTRRENKQKVQLMECLLNHKVVRVEWLKEKEDTYDIEIDGNPNFALTNGIFVHNSRENPMACLRGDTKIRCAGKDISIKEMSENSEDYIGKLTWSVNPTTLELEVDTIVAVQKTRVNAQLVRVNLSTNKYVDCTPDHRFMLRDGSYVEAKDLKSKDSLMLYSEERVGKLGFGLGLRFFEGEEIWVTEVKWLNEKEDTYDVSIKNNHNFALTNGIFVHNCIEDIFLPVWGNTGNLTFDKIGGEADIRWIRDIEDLRQQLAAALRTPLPLLGAYLKEATGPLGSQAIEKLDINFARMARKLQRTVRNGIKRICQIHLAYMNMDPDPNLFDVQMPEMSTAEEESLKESLKSGMDVIGQMMDTVDRVMDGDKRKADKVELFQYFNQKFLKLEDLDLNDFLTAAEGLTECKRRKDRMAYELKVKYLIEKAMNGDDNNRVYSRPILDNMDLVSYVPTTTHTSEGKINKRAFSKLRRRGGWLGTERSKRVWESKYGSCTVIEGEIDKDVVAGGQGVLPFKKE